MAEKLYNDYLHKIKNQIHLDPKQFWKFVKSKRGSNSFPTSMTLDDVTSDDPIIISKLFASFFSHSHNGSDSHVDSNYFKYMLNCPKTYYSGYIPDCSKVMESISTLKDEYFPGPDGVPAVVIKRCSAPLVPILVHLFSLSLQSTIFPDLWKLSFITPTHKKGTRNSIRNYRPIAKLSTIPKLFEASIYDALFFHCKSILSHKQHGFVSKRSTTTNLVHFTSTVTRALERGSEVDCIYTDFSKAFDTLSHDIITFKLNMLGFPDFFIAWISSYLSNRSYQVLFKSCLSPPFVVNSGVPQGSHLGPLLFILAINDVTNVISHSDILVYADDMKIFKVVTNVIDHCRLQNDINEFYIWCKMNNLCLNMDKCHVMTFSRKRAPSVHNYKVNSNRVSRVCNMSDLGVIFDTKLEFIDHIQMVVNKANSVLGFVRRWSRELSDPYITKALYVSFVRPILEYASPVWSPHYSSHIKRIESVQRRFVRLSLRSLPWNDPYRLPPYENRLQLLNLNTLQRRRDVTDTLFIFKVLTGNIDDPQILSVIDFNLRTFNSRTHDILISRYHRTNYGMHEPISRMVRLFNDAKKYIDFHIDKEELKTLLYSKI